ncbi:MAG: hypothetical protein V9H26_03335 [Verrucomicrobiota bacterium]
MAAIAEDAATMVSKFRDLMPVCPAGAGCYYTRRPMTSHRDNAGYKWARELEAAAIVANDGDRLWFAKQVLDGIPKPASNFEIDCLCLLRDGRGAGTRLVRLRNRSGETSRGLGLAGSLILDCHAFTNTQRFSQWCLEQGNFAWRGGLPEFQQLRMAVTSTMAWRIMDVQA